jgi:DNA-binding response OmpR family regulator
MGKTTILIVEDEEKIVSVIEAYLKREGYQTLSAGDGKTELSLFEAHRPDAVVLDRMLPVLDGDEVLKTIRQLSDVPVLMLTAKGSENDVVEGLNLGADGYVIKPFRPRELVARLEALLRRFGPKEAGDIIVINSGDLKVNMSAHQVWRGGREIPLTPNEYKLLMALIKQPAKVFTREELILCAFGFSYEGFERTIDSHIKNLRAKLEDKTEEPIYIHTVRGVGYKFGGKTDG